jgi:hypothetical protein
MAVYVDTMKASFGRMTMCHMCADTLEELHSMADKIDLNRKWFQDKKRLPHYDVCLSKRKLAIKNGAIEINQVDLVKKLYRLKGRR